MESLPACQRTPFCFLRKLPSEQVKRDRTLQSKAQLHIVWNFSQKKSVWTRTKPASHMSPQPASCFIRRGWRRCGRRCYCLGTARPRSCGSQPGEMFLLCGTTSVRHPVPLLPLPVPCPPAAATCCLLPLPRTLDSLLQPLAVPGVMPNARNCS